ncbi:hypothetical protein GYMLUDRAFT_247064 [Collybiopsis luxurians FD-317 M1]|uniref:Uncharacterized protein n=1 Tax=Collybiopsis luxurians FD-317 M1 TaxID=944289 RepID=A0A0D0CGV4_9AGAR|nr:hypothetical protein GYMLUDRAFT_247064 [Collybiopsis luxurians FD-317 M1]
MPPSRNTGSTSGSSSIASSMSTSRNASTGSRPRQPRNAFERALQKLPQQSIPDSLYSTDEDLASIYTALGCPPQAPSEFRKFYNERWDKIFNDAGRDTIIALGFKPQKGDPIHVIEIPGSKYSIRLWDGGLEAQGQYCLDFIDTCTGKAINSPDRWVLHAKAPNGTLPYVAPLISWEEAWKVPKGEIPPGEERFSIMEGSMCGLERPECESFWFRVPNSESIVLPVPKQAFAR